jgi:hypothetical protein
MGLSQAISSASISTSAFDALLSDFASDTSAQKWRNQSRSDEPTTIISLDLQELTLHFHLAFGIHLPLESVPHLALELFLLLGAEGGARAARGQQTAAGTLLALAAFWLCLRAVARRAARRFREGPLGFLTDGIVNYWGL